MAFVLGSFDKLSQEGRVTSVPKIWGYRSSTDAAATVAGSGYFNSVITKLSVGDIIYANCSDANHIYAVTSVTTNVTVSALV